MSIDYVQLDQSLSSVVSRLTPDHIKVDSSSLYKYFEARREKAWETMVALQTKTEKAWNRAAFLGAGGGMVAVGLLVAGGTAGLPAAAVVSFSSAGYFAARSIANKMRFATAERAMQRGLDLLDEPFDEAMRASLAAEQRGGLLTRLYRHVGDALQGYERQVAGIIDKIDAIGLSGPANRQKVKEILNEGMSPGLEEYVRRASSDKFSKAAHLMSRLTTRAQLERLASGASAQPPRSDDRAFAGWVAAPAGDANFLRSLGVELAGYDHVNQHFRVRAMPEAMQSLRAFESSYVMALEPSSRAVLDSAVNSAAGGPPMSYELLSRAELVGLREAILFDVALNGAERAADATHELVLTSISSEFERRLVEANTRLPGQAEPQLDA